MALKNFMGMNERPEENRVETTPKVAVPAPRTVAPSTSIDATTQVTGKLRCEEALRIDGRMKGEIHCKKTVFIGQSANVESSIDADAVVISGEVKGDIAARRKITLESTARVTGDLATPGIVIEEGAKLEGRIVIGGDDQPAQSEESAARASKPARERSNASETAPSSSTAPPAG